MTGDGRVGTLVVHPASELAYASFVIEGLAALLGPSNIRYSTEGFPNRFTGGRVLAFYRADDSTARCFLTFHDHPRVNQMGVEWARVYGMVNVREEDANGGVMPLGPTFGVRLTSTRLTARHLVHAWSWSGTTPLPAAAARVRAAYKHQRRRTTIARYQARRSEPDYIFFAAWPWAKHTEVNPPRARFIEACRRAPDLSFEGGFAPRRRQDLSDVVALSAPRRYSISEYLTKVSRSAAAFNNPAVHGCHGWKLGEFLALGKAIVTLPLSRALPAPLEHGVHVHVVDGSPESFDDAIARVRHDHRYRHALERNARAWYERHLAPDVLARRLLGALG